MKTAISVPDDIFAAAELLAARRRCSRSELYVTALRSLLDAELSITDRLNAVFDYPVEPDDAVLAASKRILRATEW